MVSLILGILFAFSGILPVVFAIKGARRSFGTTHFVIQSVGFLLLETLAALQIAIYFGIIK